MLARTPAARAHLVAGLHTEKYTLDAFFQAAAIGNMPAVSFIKAPYMQNGHPQKSDPLDEQAFLVDTINKLEQTPEWRDMVIIITGDKSPLFGSKKIAIELNTFLSISPPP